ncbi:hypothetical protein [Comamonas humi]
MAKTEKARQALQDRRHFSARERQLLILCNGERSGEEVAGWLGDGAWQMLEDLRRRGYLADAAASASVTEAQPVPGAARRSLAACKMYVLGILQMQRDAGMQPLAAALHRSADEPALVEALAMALRYVRQGAPGSYAQRVQEHVLTIMPEQHLSAFQAQLHVN